MAGADPLRTHLVTLLAWEDAHAGFDTAVAGIPADARGIVPDGWQYSAWQLVEHLRRAQADILEFCVDAQYKEKAFPDDYWPDASAPPDARAWDECVDRFRRDRDAFVRLAADPAIDLFATIPHGTGQTYVREILLAADHAAYHVGQIVALRRCLGIWNAP